MVPDPPPAITVLEGLDRINAALDLASAACRTEVLTVQPGGARSERVLTQGLDRARLFSDRGVLMRTLYQHTVRHSYGVYAYADHLPGIRIEVRTLEELFPRMMAFDRTVAVLAVTPDAHTALEVRHPEVVNYLVDLFEHFWRRAVPLDQPLTAESSDIRRSIARLLIEGLVDEAIARRLGLNIRTCRAHIAKLAATLGGTSNRAQLGYLIAKSGILDN
ncbi:helix-turn-helix transcriptional regulator [Streptomyces sp. NBC_00237]|uniref:helix-turn-helix transcriptional regulator n=1 Tax=Streptomyces sp. NBC_00237 TaxID=2975687 RepID=UPI002B1D1E5C|nr:helix-turn-helix transcriptional regulator [Streptomyces sp. NBC_00237]